MQPTVAMTIEGVLQKVVSYAPIPSGITLYNSLSSVHQIILLSDYPKEDVDRWLELEGLNKHSFVRYGDTTTYGRPASERRLAQVNYLRSRGYALDFVIDPDPGVSAAVLASGISVLNFLHTSYALPQWRPDYEFSPKPWASLEEEVRKVASLRAKDPKLLEPQDYYE